MATVEISTREAEVLALLGEHLSNAEIGARLFISVRTVESHVSSLLRKLEVPDRRALAQRASELSRAERSPAAPILPTPLTSFVGRRRERAELTELLDTHRQVTAVGPGGVGKTRLALAVAADAAGDYPDGVCFVDLVPVTDPDVGAVAAAVADALGLGEQPGRGMVESVRSVLADRHALLVLDNCEHVRDGVAPLLERLLGTCPLLTVLATSQARLTVPFERVYPVPPLSLAGEGESDAVTLFMDRVAAAGAPPVQALRDQVVSVCERLEGMALAIELAAARCPTLGLDGLMAALSDPLRMLAGGSRADERHRSVRAVLDWSHALLEPADRALLRRVSVFVAPFTVEAAVEVAGTEPGVVADGLARLAEQSLLLVTASSSGTEYRALEPVRQYGDEQLTEAGEQSDTRSRHLRWCLARAGDLAQVREDRRARFDGVADDLRAALAWAADRPEQRADAYRLSAAMATHTIDRNQPGEAQRRYEQAAALADDPATTASMLRLAADVAACRQRGDDLYRLRRAAADAARRSGDTAAAATDLAAAVTSVFRFAPRFERVPPPEETIALLDEARELADDDPAAQAAVALAEAGALTDVFGAVLNAPDDAAPERRAHAERAVELAHRTGDPIAVSAALDALTGAEGWAGDPFTSAATTWRRITVLESAPDTPARTNELIDALGTGTEASLGAGDLPRARRSARQLADHPLLAEAGHRATSWLLLTDALAGRVDDVLTVGARFLEDWQRSGRPANAALGPAVAGVAMIHGLRADDDAMREWTAVLNQLPASPGRTVGYGAVFDAMLLLHRDRADEAVERMAPESSDVWPWVTWIWLHWYVALRAEAAVLAGSPVAGDRLADARALVAGNPVAGAMVQRAQALLDEDEPQLLAMVEAFDAAGCPYQSARTLVLARGAHAADGAAALAGLGIAPVIPN